MNRAIRRIVEENHKQVWWAEKLSKHPYGFDFLDALLTLQGLWAIGVLKTTGKKKVPLEEQKYEVRLRNGVSPLQGGFWNG